MKNEGANTGSIELPLASNSNALRLFRRSRLYFKSPYRKLEILVCCCRPIPCVDQCCRTENGKQMYEVVEIK